MVSAALSSAPPPCGKDVRSVTCGSVAQMGERLVRNEEAAGSIPAGSTSCFRSRASLLGGESSLPRPFSWPPFLAVRFFTETHMTAPLIGVVMGSHSDWETMERGALILERFRVPYEAKIVSAHRTPELLVSYAQQAKPRGLRAIIAGAGGAAHLPGMLAAQTAVPVLGVPVQSRALNGVDSLLSIVQMPAGIPVATFAIGAPGATNAALFAIALLATGDARLEEELDAYRKEQRDRVLADTLPPVNR